MNAIERVHREGQSLWYDNIQRRLLENGDLAKMIAADEIRGVTSNPSIFHNAISRSSDYDAALKPMAWSGWNAEEIFYQLAVEDIQGAADLFAGLYEQTDGGDGYVSLEVSPGVAHDTEKTVEEAKRLWAWVDRPNLMVKIPATREGVAAVRQATAHGINVNVTLIFSLARYLEVMDAYISGLEDRVAAGQPVDRIASVASFFVSRVDSKIDPRLEEIVRKEGINAARAAELPGKAAIANARMAYAEFLKVFNSPRFSTLQKQGARKQRPLWASTSTKNPAYRDVLYLDELIGPDTVNTVPPQTLDAFRNHGQVRVSLGADVSAEEAQIRALEELGISMEQVTAELEAEGVKAFSDAFNALLKTIDERRLAALKELGPLQGKVAEQVHLREQNRAAERMASADPTLWTADESQHAEISRRLGWLNLPQRSRALLPALKSLRKAVTEAGYTHALLLGMGGSSLAPEVYREIFGLQETDGSRPLDLAILDSTDPGQVKAAEERSPLGKTLYIVASKSGTTGEIQAFFDYFWAKAAQAFGERAGEHFVAITDPGTVLERTAQERKFRQVFLSDPNVGGRYSALTAFGLVPAALIGMDVEKLLDRAQWMADQCRPEVPAGRNPGLVLGAILGEGNQQGQDKLTVITDPQVCPFGSWLEQLVAESSGKEGRGIVPVDMEPYMRSYSFDRLFVYFRSTGEHQAFVERLIEQGHTALTLGLENAYELGAACYQWEVATAIATAILGVNGFDQPDVQDNKTRTKDKIAQFTAGGKLDDGKAVWESGQGAVYGAEFTGLNSAASLQEVVAAFIRQACEGDYIAINAYLPRDPQMLAKLQELRKGIQAKTGRATTLGFGPRFLHSTGQLHKGGANNGLFLQLTAEPQQDLDIPEEGITFGVLERAQAIGDLEALQARGRRVIRIHLRDAEPQQLI